MGARQSRSENGESSEAGLRHDTFALWPGLDKQLEAAFAAMCNVENGEDTLSYDKLEPVLRHLLMQIGLIEYVTRFAEADGTLRCSEVEQYLRLYDVDIRHKLDLIDWKNLMLSWIRRIQDAQESDIRKWQNSIERMQQEQAYKYHTAMKQFQKHYIEQLKTYYDSVEEVHRKEEEYRKEWESSLALQEEFYQRQMQFLQEQNDEATLQYAAATKDVPDQKDLLLQHLDLGRSSSGQITTVRFAYPVGVTTTGAPVSGGARIPTRRPARRQLQQAGCC